MRTITQIDVHFAARYLWNLPQMHWKSAIVKALGCAHAADNYRKRFGRLHPTWGNGTLAAAVASAGPLAAEKFLSDQRFLEATQEAIHQILEWRRRQIIND